MTIAACYHSNEGVILGADSAATIVPPNLVGVSVAIRHFNHAQKIFEIGCNNVIGPMAIAAFGLGDIGGISHRTMAAEFADELESKPPISMDEVATRWSERVWATFTKAYAPLQARALELTAKGSLDASEEAELRNLKQVAGGYFLAGRLSKQHFTSAFNVDYDLFLGGAPKPGTIPVGQMATAGCNNVFLRLVKGYDPQIIESIMASKKWTGTMNELIENIKTDQMFPSVVLNVRDAVDLVYSMIYGTIKTYRFSQYAPLCGGPIEVAAITTDRPFRWVMHKSLGVAVQMALYNET